MAGVTCRDCAIPYDVWPEDGCPNCGSGEPADAMPFGGADGPGHVTVPAGHEVPAVGDVLAGLATATPLAEAPEPPAAPARTRAGRRGGRARGGP